MKYFCVSLALLTASTSGCAGQFEDCRSHFQSEHCRLLYVRHSGVEIYSSPSVKPERVGILAAGYPIRVDWVTTNSYGGPWVFVENKGRMDKKNISPHGWIEAKNLAGDSDFKPVIDCWPIKSIKDDNIIDGSPLEITFTRSGKEAGGRRRVWFTANVARIGDSLGEAITYGYDNETFQLFDPIMSYSASVTLFSETEMAGCQRGRIVL
jgi:hypothetical protein